MSKRRKTREVTIGDKKIGGDNPILVQSMTNTKTSDIDATVRQIKRLEEAGCDIARVAVPDVSSSMAIKEIKRQVDLPIVADIHFDHKLALSAIENGADKLRINPGNIGSRERTEAVVKAAAERGIPIRIGVNSGSVEKDLIEKYGGPTPEALVESAHKHIQILEDLGFEDTVVSLKASSVRDTVEANRLFSRLYDYPLHLGVTEAGLPRSGIIKSSIGLGSLLLDGIGDTVRVSLTGEPEEEVSTAIEILKSLDLKTGRISPEVISCPTCGRTGIDLIGLTQEVEERIKDLDKNVKVAVMGCVVNGPGEAKNADVGIAGGNGKAVIFKKGEIIKSVDEEDIVDELVKEIESL